MQIEKIYYDFVNFVTTSKEHLPLVLKIIGSVWILNFINWSLKSFMTSFGIQPRKLKGLIGILFSHFIHGNFNHLFFNSIPFFVLSIFILGKNPSIFINLNIFIFLVSGTLLWLFGRRGYHIGASDIIAGYFSYVIFLAYKDPSVASILIAIVSFYYFGAILFSFIPTEDKTSFEGHLFGLISGVAAVYYLHS